MCAVVENGVKPKLAAHARLIDIKAKQREKQMAKHLEVAAACPRLRREQKEKYRIINGDKLFSFSACNMSELNDNIWLT